MNMHLPRITKRIIYSFFRALAPVLSALVVACGLSPLARADCVPTRKASAPKDVTSDNKTRALGRYKIGNELLKKSDYEGALELFHKSRELWPNRSNTKNAAICLFELGLYPEALALYEELLHQFAADLDAEERALVAKAVEDLQKKVLIVDIVESTGTFSIDDQTCGALPRIAPVYLLPGSHIFRILRPGLPESLEAFSGEAGTRIAVKLPTPPAPAPLPPDPGRWFVQAAVAPAIAWSGIGTVAVEQLEQSTGVLAQAQGGYRLSNGTMIALSTGLLYLSSSADLLKGFDFLDFEYTGKHAIQFFAPFVGVTAGWGTNVGQNFDVWFRGELGLMSTQSKNALDVNLVPLLEIGGRQQKRISVDIGGRDIIRSVPGYAAVEMGAAWHVRRLRVGFSIGGLFLLDNGPILPDVYLMTSGRDSEAFNGVCGRDSNTMAVDRNDADCVPAVRKAGQRAYRPTFVLLPQLVIGF